MRTAWGEGSRTPPLSLDEGLLLSVTRGQNTYDPLNRLTSVQSGGQQTSYAYDAAGNLVQTTLPAGNGYVETRAYDRAGRLVSVESKKGATTLARFQIALDAAGNPLQIVRTGSLSQTQPTPTTRATA